MDIRDIKGIGEKTASLFGKLGIYTMEELLQYYPRNYDCFESPICIRDFDDSKTAALKGVILDNPTITYTNRYKLLSVIVKDENNDRIKLIWYNMPFLKGTLKSGSTYIFRGRINYKGNNIIMEQPEIYSLHAYDEKMGEMQPIYGLTKGLSGKTVIKAVKEALNICNHEKDYLPLSLRKEYHLAEYNFSVRNIHFPKDMDNLREARKRLAFDEFFKFIISLREFKGKDKREKNNFIIKHHKETEKIIEGLPFNLTDAQKTVFEEIKSDLSGQTAMNRLIQGDVGSGKTIVAVLAMIDTALSEYQAIMMAPTEVLAKQHYDYITKMITDFNLPIEASILTGSMTAKQKRIEYERIKSGITKIIIGTHAIIQENVIFDNPALVITDEQHRFGVRQRENLAEKGCRPHILVMSATPIPRTLAIILYGDLDISVMNQMPADRLPIKNCVVGTDYRNNAYKFIEKEVKKGRQVYVICAMVEESDNYEAENVMDYSKKLKNILPSDICVEYLHGKMKPSMKNLIMERFATGEINVLVSTTVIEVGINVPNATVMMIEDAQRFGLAALHQLRGRVGRGKHQSYCIFVNTSKSTEAQKRLDILNKSNDGFFIASQDMKLRGPGDFFGVRQSGEMDFNIADIYSDADILKNASEAVEKMEIGKFEMSAEEKDIYIQEIEKCIKKAYSNINL
ncbi:MAG: ATP-dependent DNA helicase RecG [Lachnospiraceae bacterium]|nr:ATP-dependent DNA helicase RecG [Lachnospiraceae bacterium]